MNEEIQIDTYASLLSYINTANRISSTIQYTLTAHMHVHGSIINVYISKLGEMIVEMIVVEMILETIVDR